MRDLTVCEIEVVAGGNGFLLKLAKWAAGNLSWEALKASGDFDQVAFAEFVDNTGGANMK